MQSLLGQNGPKFRLTLLLRFVLYKIIISIMAFARERESYKN